MSLETPTILTLEVRHESDLVAARQRVRRVAALLGFDATEQTRVATAASEVVRDINHLGAVACTVSCRVDPGPPPSLAVGIGSPSLTRSDLQDLADGRAGPVHGPGLDAARRLMEHFAVEANPKGPGAAIILAKPLPRRTPPPGPAELERIAEELRRQAPAGPLEEVRQQNSELLRTLGELRDLQTQTAQLNLELEETNRGVLALHTELDDKANALQRASELKTRFLSEISHEFRSPLNTIGSLARFLLDRADGPLTAEQEKQVRFIGKAAAGLSELVDDLLDLAKVEAGKTVVRPEAFAVAELFSTLRGMVRPLLSGDAVVLIFDETEALPPLYTDPRKLSQILRNFLTNALKFTEWGEIRVSATAGPEDSVVFAVADTGIGIAPADQGRIFEEFSQVEGPIQSRVKGTGLGLSLSRRLAEILGGGVSLRSTPGVGSTFLATVPRLFRPDPLECDGHPDGTAEGVRIVPQPDPSRAPVLIVEDDLATLYLYERYLEGTGFQVLPAISIAEARRLLDEVTPAAVILDIVLEAESGWTLLEELRRRQNTRSTPIFVLTVVDGMEKALALGADEFVLKPVDRAWLVEKLGALRGRGGGDRILIVDDDPADRYMLVRLLAGLGYSVLEATNGVDGLARARADRPEAILLDLVMPDLTGFQVLDLLKSDPATESIPVLIHSSRTLDQAERRRLALSTSAILSKGGPSREAGLERLREALELAGLRPGPAPEAVGE